MNAEDDALPRLHAVRRVPGRVVAPDRVSATVGHKYHHQLSEDGGNGYSR